MVSWKCFQLTSGNFLFCNFKNIGREGRFFKEPLYFSYKLHTKPYSGPITRWWTDIISQYVPLKTKIDQVHLFFNQMWDEYGRYRRIMIYEFHPLWSWMIYIFKHNITIHNFTIFNFCLQNFIFSISIST